MEPGSRVNRNGREWKMTIEEIKAYLEGRIGDCNKRKRLDLWGEELNGQYTAYTDALRLLNDWNGK